MSAYERLNPRQQKFVDAFLEFGNATKATIKAGFSERSARNQASRMMTNDDIQAAIAERRAPILKAAAEKLGIRSLDIIEELAAIAFSDPRRIARWGPNGVTLTPSEELTEKEAKAVAEVSVHRSKRGTRVRYRMHDKVRALIELADRFGIDKAEMQRLFPQVMTPEQRRARILELIKKGRRLALAEHARKQMGKSEAGG